MLILAAPGDKIEFVTSAAANVDAYLSYVDKNGSTITAAAAVANTQIAETKLLVSGPGAGQRNSKFASWRNKHATNPTNLIVQITIGGVTVEVKKVTLNPNDELHYVNGLGFLVL